MHHIKPYGLLWAEAEGHLRPFVVPLAWHAISPLIQRYLSPSLPIDVLEHFVLFSWPARPRLG